MARNVFEDLRQTLDRLSEQFEGEFGREGEAEAEAPWRGSISVDVSETDNEITVTADLPGFDPEDVDVRVTDDTLTISAEHTEESEEPAEAAGEGEGEAEEAAGEEGEERYLRRERTHRSVHRRIPLPAPVDEDAAEAEFENGVLTVTLPKSEEAQGTRIEIS